jgi:hypothetical protein
MPLTPNHNKPVEYDLYLGVIFVMADGEHRVICRVTKAALDDRAVISGRRLTTVEMFEKFRSEIERAASRQYDSGIKTPLVDSEDLVPIRIASARSGGARYARLYGRAPVSSNEPAAAGER